ncbi:hypothetical protein A0H81_01031 [Grifola frondosa]|uniref:Uncharacterized protein n=1 Tax=Grifola frondosa TaxID=5627 RepID=A0A1C7MJL2_GRIFR|nr:hypothetical protein A0H81_03026 [Grifola frondosa]OBZ76619.1 hypothetical protein A0H81_03263 [Grifola frondosa]OBZ78875.1 hypothetical protein A0H81_01031 [Grifola frondosa]
MITSQHQTLLQRIRDERHEVLQYDIRTKGLCTWYWPLEDGGRRVTPSALRERRMTYKFTGPCCLCPNATPDEGHYTEAATLIAIEGPCSGEYVAMCAKGSCGYLVYLERIFAAFFVKSKQYDRREPGDLRPATVFHFSEVELDNAFRRRQSGTEHSDSRKLKRTYAMLDVTAEEIKVTPADRPVPRPIIIDDVLRKLDSLLDPGISDAQFGFVMARCALQNLQSDRSQENIAIHDTRT